MISPRSALTHMYPPGSAPLFSGHETFALRGAWLKKSYDLLQVYPDLFSREDAFVLLGVGKNMATSIRHWSRVCGVLTKRPDNLFAPTLLGDALLSDDGWDPFLVTPAARWLLHWELCSRVDAPATWLYIWNFMRSGEFTVESVASELRNLAADLQWRVPSIATVQRDVDTFLNSYTKPLRTTDVAEDTLSCPLVELNLIQTSPVRGMYSIQVGRRVDLPDALVAYAISSMLAERGQQTIAFTELAYAPRSPGRIFRMDEDDLLARLYRLSSITQDAAYYSDQAGVRQVAWRTVLDAPAVELLSVAFEDRFAEVG